MKAFLVSMFSDSSDGISTMRVLLTLWTLGIMAAWLAVALGTHTIPDIPSGVLALTGMLVGGKVIQRFGEEPAKTG